LGAILHHACSGRRQRGGNRSVTYPKSVATKARDFGHPPPLARISQSSQCRMRSVVGASGGRRVRDTQVTDIAGIFVGLGGVRIRRSGGGDCTPDGKGGNGNVNLT